MKTKKMDDNTMKKMVFDAKLQEIKNCQDHIKLQGTFVLSSMIAITLAIVYAISNLENDVLSSEYTVWVVPLPLSYYFLILYIILLSALFCYSQRDFINKRTSWFSKLRSNREVPEFHKKGIMGKAIEVDKKITTLISLVKNDELLKKDSDAEK